MKWKLLLLIPLCLTLLSPLTTIAGESAYRLPINNYPSDVNKNPITKPIPSKIDKVGKGLEPANDASKFSKTKKIVKVGAALKTANHIRRNKWKYAAGAVIVGATAASYYRNDIDRIIDREFYSDKWRSEKKKKLVPILQKKINNAKPEKKEAVVEAIQESLIYYMSKYNGESAGKLATSILESLNIMNNQVMMQASFETQQRNDARVLIKLKIDEVDKTRKRTDCRKGSYEREYITTNNSFGTNGLKSLSEFDVDHYGVQQNINRAYNEGVHEYNKYKKPHDLPQKFYDFEKDHIPSKKAVALYLAKRDNFGVLYGKPKSDYIIKNAISVVMRTSIHKRGRTNGKDNIDISKEDAKNLKQAIFDDFEEYYLLASIDNQNDYSYKTNWVKALIKTYIENEKMCLFL
jgi:hypothetical protein